MEDKNQWRLMIGPDGDTWVLDESDDLSDMSDGYRVIEVVPVAMLDNQAEKALIAELAKANDRLLRAQEKIDLLEHYRATARDDAW